MSDFGAAQWRLRLADGAATDAAAAHATALGVLEMVDRFRFRDVSDPIPAPGAAEIPDRIHTLALDALHAAASCRILVDDLVASTNPGEVCEIWANVQAASDRAMHAAAEAQRALRRLAQIGLGIAQHAYADDDVELLERMAIGILLGSDGGFGRAARDDQPGLDARWAPELSVELAGLIARMLCDQSSGADPYPSIALVADGMPELVVAITEGGGVHVPGVARFEPPVSITAVSALVVERIADHGTSLAQVRLRWPSDPGDNGQPTLPFDAMLTCAPDPCDAP